MMKQFERERERGAGMKRAITLILAILMVLSVTGLQAFADDQPVGKGYLAIGDSITIGVSKDHEGDQYDDFKVRYVDGSFTQMLAGYLDYLSSNRSMVAAEDSTDTFWPLAYPGMTTTLLMDLLGLSKESDKDDRLVYRYYGDILYYFGNTNSNNFYEISNTHHDTVEIGTLSASRYGKTGDIVKLIKNTDVITLQLGLSDVFYRAYRIVTEGGTLAEGVSLDLSDPAAILNLVKTAVTEMITGYSNWEKNYPKLLDEIYRLNPDAEVVIVGSFNLINELTISDDIKIPIGSIFSPIVDKMNRTYAKWAKEYAAKGYNIVFADITNAETLATEEEWSLLGGLMEESYLGTHPLQNGYDYIYRQVVRAMNHTKAMNHTNYGKNIVVDLGRFNKVKRVYLDGIPVTEFSKMLGEGFSATKDATDNMFSIFVPNFTSLAKNLTVISEGADGKEMMISYKLSYQGDTGYVAHRLFAMNDYVPITTKLTSMLKSTLGAIFNAVKTA